MSYSNVRYPPYHIRGLKLKLDEDSPDSKLVIETGEWKEDTNTYEMITTEELEVDITVSGAGGLDQGAEAADTWYYVWIIQESTTSACAGLFSTSFTAPLMPSGYIYKRRIGSVRNDSSSNFLNFYQFGNEGIREYYYREDMSGLEVLSDGSAEVFADVDLTDLIPETSVIGLLGLHNANAIKDLTIRPDEMVVGYLLKVCCGKNNNYCWTAVESRILEYQMDGPGGGADIYVLGYKEEI